MEIGEIVYESSSTVTWEIGSWKIFKDSGNLLHSPKFKFMDETCFVAMNRYDMYIGLYFHFERPMIPDDNIWFKLSLKTSDGKERIIDSGSFITRKLLNISMNFIKFEKSSILKEAEDLATNSPVIVYFDIQKERMSATESCEGKAKHEGTDSDEKEQNKDDGKEVFNGSTGLEKMSQDFNDLLLSGEASDMTVKVNDTEFHVHKLILSARSPVFASMFKHDMKEKSTGIVEISDCTTNAFYDLLQFIYSGKLKEFSREKVFDLYLAADKYDVKDLKSDCVKFIEKDLCIETFCDALLIALRHGESFLLETISKFFAKNMKKVIITVKWQTFIKENPMEANELFIKALNID